MAYKAKKAIYVNPNGHIVAEGDQEDNAERIVEPDGYLHPDFAERWNAVDLDWDALEPAHDTLRVPAKDIVGPKDEVAEAKAEAKALSKKK